MTTPGPTARPRPTSGLAAAASADFSVQDALGGVRGMVESVVPVVVFSVVFALVHQVVTASAVAVAVSVVLVVARAVRREPVMPAVSGLLAVGVGAVIAVVWGQARGFYVPSLVKNPAFALGYAVSALVGWPLVGVLLGFVLGEGTAWREVPARRRAYTQATWLWTAMFALRFAVMAPLYAADDTNALGVAQVVLSLPLYGLVLLGTWLIVRRVPTVVRPAPDAADAPADPDVAPGAAPGTPHAPAVPEPGRS